MANLNLATLFVDIKADKLGMNEVKNNIDSIGGSVDKTSSKTDILNDTMQEFGIDTSKILAGGTVAMVAGITAVVAALGACASQAIRTATEISRLSETAGMTNEEFQKWNGVFEQVGYSMEQAIGDMAMLQEKMYDASMATGEGAELFAALGIAVTNTDGTLKSTNDTLLEVYMSLQNMEDVAQRNAIASALLGTTYEETSKILGMTNEELVALKDNVNVIRDDDIEQVNTFNKSWYGVKKACDDIMNDIGMSLIPVLDSLCQILKLLEPLIDAIVVVLTAFIDVVAITCKGIEALVKVMAGDFTGAATAFKEMGNIFIGTAKDVDDYASEHFGNLAKGIDQDMQKSAESVEKSASRMNNAMSDVSVTFRNKNFVGNGGTEYGYAPDGSFGQYYGSHANGIDYVPFDGYKAELHQGERVLSASENATRTVGNDSIEKLLSALIQKVDRIPKELLKNERMVRA